MLIISVETYAFHVSYSPLNTLQHLTTLEQFSIQLRYAHIVVIRVFSLLARLGLSAVFLISGYLKAADIKQTVIAVRAYRLLPEVLVEPMAIGLPLFELVLGVLLLIGLFTRIAAFFSAIVMIAFIGAIASAWARGFSIDCGCFGGGGESEDASARQYATEITRDVGFLILAIWLTVFPRTPLALGLKSRTRFIIHKHSTHQE